MNAHQYQEALIHEAINGSTSIRRGPGVVVSLTESLPVGVGPAAVQPFVSGKSSNVRTTWVEQGWGHDSQRWPSYPFSELGNPARRRSPVGKLSDDQRVNLALHSYEPIFGPDQGRQTWARERRRSGANAHGAIVTFPDPVNYTDTVPSYGGGAVVHPGVDIPLGALYG